MADTSIYRLFNPRPVETPDEIKARQLSMATVGQQQQLNTQHMQLNDQTLSSNSAKAQEYQAATERASRARGVFEKYGPTRAALKELYQVDPKAGDALSDALDKSEKATAEVQKAKDVRKKDFTDAVARGATGVLLQPPDKWDAQAKVIHAQLLKDYPDLVNLQTFPYTPQDESSLRALASLGQDPDKQNADKRAGEAGVRADEAALRAAAVEKRNQAEHDATIEGKRVDPATGVTKKEAALAAQTAARDAQTVRHQTAMERNDRGSLALRQKTFDATLGSGLDANGKPLSAEEQKTAALADPTANAIANYQIKAPAVGRGATKATMDKVMRINPQYDANKFAQRNKVENDFSAAGVSGKAITAADTALAHLATLEEAGTALTDTNIPMLNSIAQRLGAAGGGDAKTTYDTIVSMVAPEISKAVIGQAGALKDREDMEANFLSKRNDGQRKGAIGGAVKLLTERVNKQRQAYEADMGKPLSRELSPESQAIAGRHGGAKDKPKSKAVSRSQVQAYADAHYGGDFAKAKAAVEAQGKKVD